MRPVPFLNLKKNTSDHKKEFLEAIEGVLNDAEFVGGPRLAEFEKQFAGWVGPGNFVVGCANGTDAITLAALALKLPKGSQAIVPAMTYVASVAALLHAGLEVRLVDVDAKTWLMDPASLKEAISPNTKLIVPVHVYGQMPAMDEIRKIADVSGIKILEDASQAHGALWKGQPPGHWSDIATYSFYPGKNLGAFGDAGAILSRDAALIEYCRALGNQGGLKKYEHTYLGYNSRLDTVQAAILSVKLKYLSGWNQCRRNIAGAYFEMLSGIDELQLPYENPSAISAYHLFVCLTPERDRLMAHLASLGITAGIHYPAPIHNLPSLKGRDFGAASFPVAERICREGISLPICPTLDLSQVEIVAQAVRGFFGRK